MNEQLDLRPMIRKLVGKTNLSAEEISLTLDAILGGDIPDGVIAAFLVALAMKGETAEELRSVLLSLRNHALRITPRIEGPLVDTCGTGGDSIRSFNISTAAAIVAAGAGANIAKHGNRSVSGICGSADFLEFTGLDLDAQPLKIQSCIENIGIGFLFAPTFHPSIRHIANVRKSIGIRTVFNMVGPLSNPCTNISGQVIGVFEPSLLKIFSEVCQGYLEQSIIVHAHDGFDELSNTCENDIIQILGSQIKRIRFHPKTIGMKVSRPEQLVVNNREDSVRITLETIYGKATTERQDIVILNAAAALIVAKIATDFREGVEIATESVKSGRARDKLSQLIKYCGNLEKLREVEKRFSLA